MAIDISPRLTEQTSPITNKGASASAASVSSANASAPAATQSTAASIATERDKTVPASAETAAAVNSSSLQDTIAKANQLPSFTRRSLEFKLDADYGRPIITVRDTDTNEVIRQIPPEEIVEFSKYLREVADNHGEGVKGLVVRLDA